MDYFIIGVGVFSWLGMCFIYGALTGLRDTLVEVRDRIKALEEERRQ